MNTVLTIGIVGHTNTGKTSLIRTLLRNSQFGEVRNAAGTTRHVQSATLAADASRNLELRDTPGLEDSVALHHYLLQLQQQGHQHRECLQACIEQSANTPEFEQEIKVLKQALECQVLLYVIDCREPVFAKYTDEIAILRLAAIPILPVLNFIHADASTRGQWQQTLAQLGLHAQVAFDTVAYDFDAEKRLYQKLQTLQENHYGLLQTLIEKREQDWRQLRQTAHRRLARLLLQACKIQVPLETDRSQTLRQLQDLARQLEQEALQDILHIMQFQQQDIAMTQLPVSDGHWQMDLFSKQTLKTLGLDTASAAATGAALGVGIDLMFAGISLGAATAAGAALGAAWHTGKRFGKNLLNTLTGNKFLALDDTTLDLLLLRQRWLLQTVFQRGHAATAPSQLHNRPTQSLPKDWSAQRQLLRASAAGFGLSEDEALTQTATWLATLADST